jgi:hypothetical protein
MLTGFLLIVTALIMWGGLLYFAPFGPCPRCHGTGRVWRGTRQKPRPIPCPSCKGIRRRQRPGSRTVHRIARRIRRELARQRKERDRIITTTEE